LLDEDFGDDELKVIVTGERIDENNNVMDTVTAESNQITGHF
jgi:hypothetical protein